MRFLPFCLLIYIFTFAVYLVLYMYCFSAALSVLFHWSTCVFHCYIICNISLIKSIDIIYGKSLFFKFLLHISLRTRLSMKNPIAFLIKIALNLLTNFWRTDFFLPLSLSVHKYGCTVSKLFVYPLVIFMKFLQILLY